MKNRRRFFAFVLCFILCVLMISSCSTVRFPDDGVYVCENPYICYTQNADSNPSIKMDVNGESKNLKISLGYDSTFNIFERKFDENLIEENDYQLFRGEFNVNWEGNIKFRFYESGKEIMLIKQ